MNRKITVIATLAAAPIAAGQSWDFELSDPVLSPDSPSTTVTLFADVDPSEWLAGALLDVHASEEGWSDLKVRIPSSAAPRIALKAGEIRGAIVEGIVVGQLECIFGYSPDPGRIPVWEANFNVTDFAERTVDLATETERLDVYVEFCSYPGRVETRIPAEGGAMIEVIPAPGSLALLALGAVGALRRRRNIKETER